MKLSEVTEDDIFSSLMPLRNCKLFQSLHVSTASRIGKDTYVHLSKIWCKMKILEIQLNGCQRIFQIIGSDLPFENMHRLNSHTLRGIEVIVNGHSTSLEVTYHLNYVQVKFTSFQKVIYFKRYKSDLSFDA